MIEQQVNYIKEDFYVQVYYYVRSFFTYYEVAKPQILCKEKD